MKFLLTSQALVLLMSSSTWLWTPSAHAHALVSKAEHEQESSSSGRDAELENERMDNSIPEGYGANFLRSGGRSLADDAKEWYKIASSVFAAIMGRTVATSSTGSSTICPLGYTCNTLEELIDYGVKQRMPLRDSELYVPPDPSTMADFEMVVAAMMEGTCDEGQLPSSLSSSYAMELFEDDGDDGKMYCVLASTADDNGDGIVDNPWGTVVVNHDADAQDLSIDIVHPFSDSHTTDQGIAVFKGTNARTFLLSGSQRYANNEPSPCQPDYEIADAAHAENAFLSSVSAIFAYYVERGRDHTSIQFHGMGSSTCSGVDAFLTQGSDVVPNPSDKHYRLRFALEAALEDGTKTLTVPGNVPSCALKGSRNVQGRLLNGVPREDVCDVAATDISGRFVHVEQKYWLRDPDNDYYDAWCTAINSMLASLTLHEFFFNDFEEGWGNFTDGGGDAYRNTKYPQYAYQSDCSLTIRDNSGEYSSVTTEVQYVSSFETLWIEFHYYARSMEVNENFFLEYSKDDGGWDEEDGWNFIMGIDFSNDEWNAEVVGPINVADASTFRFRFRCDASTDYDWIYLDDVRLSGKYSSTATNLAIE